MEIRVLRSRARTQCPGNLMWSALARGTNKAISDQLVADAPQYTYISGYYRYARRRQYGDGDSGTLCGGRGGASTRPWSEISDRVGAMRHVRCGRARPRARRGGGQGGAGVCARGDRSGHVSRADAVCVWPLELVNQRARLVWVIM